MQLSIRALGAERMKDDYREKEYKSSRDRNQMRAPQKSGASGNQYRSQGIPFSERKRNNAQANKIQTINQSGPAMIMRQAN